MDLNAHWKWSSARRWSRMENVLILCTTMCIFSLMMLLKVEMYNGNAVLWNSDFSEQTVRTPVRQMEMPAMKTIVAYSPEKREEMDRRYPVVCENLIKLAKKQLYQEGSWQDVGGGVSLYSGYYDDRIPNRPYLRILAVTNGSAVDELGPLYCQTVNNGYVTSIEATLTSIWWKEWDPGSRDAITPMLISCELPEPKTRTFSTSVSADQCGEVKNVLYIKPNVGEVFRNFTVCVKDLRFEEDVSERLVEWFELLKMLGADKVDVYVAEVPLAVQRVLNYYNESGLATIRRAPRPVTTSLWQRRRDHLLAYNDCLYRNLRESRYVVPLDVDEVIVPRRNETWSQLLDKLTSLETKPPGAASLAVSNAFFFDSFSEENNESRRRPHTLTHVWRSSLISPVPQYSKSFVSTSRALTVFNHYALSAIGEAERARAVPVDLALLHHYKATCRPALVECHQYTTTTVKDDTVLRYAGQLTANINKVLKSF